MSNKQDTNKERCEDCNHEICPHCKLGCHNPDCNSHFRPAKVCYDNFMKSTLPKKTPVEEREPFKQACEKCYLGDSSVDLCACHYSKMCECHKKKYGDPHALGEEKCKWDVECGNDGYFCHGHKKQFAEGEENDWEVEIAEIKTKAFTMMGQYARYSSYMDTAIQSLLHKQRAAERLELFEKIHEKVMETTNIQVIDALEELQRGLLQDSKDK